MHPINYELQHDKEPSDGAIIVAAAALVSFLWIAAGVVLSFA